ncbi:hypothetical protein CMK11_03020 [Candidatus Poribacteria bacterium]|nr:hypothetical protein [Candidatus Poribacteria bacterium]
MPTATLRLAAFALTALCASAAGQALLEPVHVVGADDRGADALSADGMRSEIGALWDVTRAFASRPGVVGTSDRTTNLSVRGGDPTENLVRIDGVDVPSIGHMAWQGETGGVQSMLSLGAIRDATFATGAFPARYGGRMSSVLDIRLREGDRGRARASAELSPAGAAGVLSGPFAGGRGTWIASYRAGLLDLVRRSAALIAVPSTRDAHAKIVYDISPRSHVSAFALTGSSAIAIGATRPDMQDEFASTRRAIGATWTREYGRRTRARLTFSDVRVAYDALAWEPPILEPAYTNASTETRSGVEAAADLALASALDVTVGARFDRIAFSHDISSRPWRGFSENAARAVWLGRHDVDVVRVGHRVAAYVEASHSPAPRLTLEWGLRGTRLSLNRDAGVEPRLSATVALGEHTAWRMAAGVSRQSPTYLEMTVHEANAALPDARATHVVTGVTHRPSETVTLAAEAYVKAYRGLRTLVEEGSRRPSGELRSSRERLARGVELEADVRRPHGHVTAVASLSRATARDEPGTPAYSDDFDYRLVATLAASRELGSDWGLGAKWRLVGGRPYTSYQVRDTYAGRYEVVPSSATRNGERYPSYRRLDLRLTRRVRWAGRDVGVFLEIENALDGRNVYSWRFDPTRGEFTPVYQFPRLVVVGLTASLPRP